MKQRVLNALIATGVVLAAASCDPGVVPGEPGIPDEPVTASTVVDGAALGAEVERDLAALRRLTAPMHRFEHATSEDVGWTVQATGCRDNAELGGMGYHYANPAYLDGVVEVMKPEILMYEPQKNGSMRLVGIEYIIPFALLDHESEPPTLMGQTLKQNFNDEVWMLHVWVWQDNPDGIFADWNPTVTCAYATD